MNEGQCVVGIDLGGTNIKGAIVSPDLEIISTVYETASSSSESSSQAQSKILDFIRLIISQNSHLKPVGCGFGVPAPFDYEEGISLMKHKFAGLYGINLRKNIKSEFGFPTFFLKDADAFAIGIWHKAYPSEKRLLAVTLGTGLGSSFVVDGKVSIDRSFGIPEQGEIWNLEFKGGRMEDYISKRGIEEDFRRSSGRSMSVKEIADLAKRGEEPAQEVFHKFGQLLGQGLSSCRDFHPTQVVFGGHIARSFELFGCIAETEYRRCTGEKVPFTSGHGHSYSVIGAAYHALVNRS